MDRDEDIQDALQEFLAKGQLEEAIKFLISMREEARRRRGMEESAHLGSLLGSCLRAAGRDLEAEKAYLEAEAENPGDPFLKMAVANFYVDVLGDPSKALPRIESALPNLAHSHSTYHAAQASLGTVCLALGRVDDALKAFKEMTKPHVLNGLYSASHDLRLVSAFIDQKLVLEECRQYLAELKKLSVLEGDIGTTETSEWLLGKLS